MTVFAGVIRISGGELPQNIITDASKASLVAFNQGRLARSVGSPLGNNGILFSCDLHEKPPHRTLQETDEAISLLVGEAFFSPTTDGSESALVNNTSNDDELSSLLAAARGVFAGVKYTKSSGELALFTDKSGIRPVFYYQHDDFLYFSTQRAFFEHLSVITLEFEFEHLCESMAMRFCLSNKTAYKDLWRLDSGQWLNIRNGNVERRRYWDWATVPSKKTVTDTDVANAYAAFKSAVELRLGGEKQAIAFLSGGLDSRAICSELKQSTDELLTFNFATVRSRDNEFARLYAETDGLIHYEKEMEKLYFPNWAQLVADTIPEQASKINPSTNEHKVWSGDGGSVAVGGVYISEAIRDKLAANGGEIGSARAAEQFLKESLFTVPKRFIRSEYHGAIPNLLEAAIAREIEETPEDPAKAMYHFLMNNDQKRHLEDHFESICEHGIELVLPFFDSDFLTHMYALPTEELINHKFYMQWFGLFSSNARKTPWQTYPGHEACPVAFSGELTNQWDKKKRPHTRSLDFKTYLKARKTPVFKQFLDPTQVAIAMLLHRTGIKDFSFLVVVLKDLCGFSTR